MVVRINTKDVRECVRLYLRLCNTVLPENQVLLESEIEVVAEFCMLPERFKYSLFSVPAKRKVAESLGKTRVNISNKLYSLSKKKFLRRDVDGVLYLPKHLSLLLEEYKNGYIDVTFRIEEIKR